MKGRAHPSPFAALSFSNSKKVPIFCWVNRESFPVATWRSRASNSHNTVTFCAIAKLLSPLDHGAYFLHLKIYISMFSRRMNRNDYKCTSFLSHNLARSLCTTDDFAKLPSFMKLSLLCWQNPSLPTLLSCLPSSFSVDLFLFLVNDYSLNLSKDLIL